MSDRNEDVHQLSCCGRVFPRQYLLARPDHMCPACGQLLPIVAVKYGGLKITIAFPEKKDSILKTK